MSEESANASRTWMILALSGFSALAYGLLAVHGDLRKHLVLYLSTHALLLGGMLLVRRLSRGDHRSLIPVLGAALLFRVVAGLGAPALSEDVHRYVWDGRVQAQGIHPYAHAPDDPALADLRDASWAEINHPELKTIYPPLAQILFLLLAGAGAGPVGFKLAMGLADFGVVLAILVLLRRLRLPEDRVVLYAWNPLAVMETAGSGHVEPLGVLLLLAGLGALLTERRGWSILAVAASVHVKLLPLVLLPGCVRRWRRWAWLFPLALLVPWLPYALTGPAVGAGLFDYAERWEHNAFFYPAIEASMEWVGTGERLKPVVGALQERWPDAPLPWDWVYRHVWPRDVARLLVLLAVGLLAVWLGWRERFPPPREQMLVIGTLLLLSPTLHPWYLLWILPFAAIYVSWGWLLLGMLAPLSYMALAGDVSWPIKLVEYVPPLALMACAAGRARLLAFRG